MMRGVVALLLMFLLGGCAALRPAASEPAPPPPPVIVQIDAPEALQKLLDTHLDLARLVRVASGEVNEPISESELRRLENATPAQARDGQSKWFFTDVDLWLLAIYAELAGIHEAVPSVRSEIDKGLSPTARDSLQGLLQLLRARLTLTSIEASRLGGGKVSVADLDRGFWRHYVDNRYAGYKGKEPPVSCSKS